MNAFWNGRNILIFLFFAGIAAVLALLYILFGPKSGTIILQTTDKERSYDVWQDGAFLITKKGKYSFDLTTGTHSIVISTDGMQNIESTFFLHRWEDRKIQLDWHKTTDLILLGNSFTPYALSSFKQPIIPSNQQDIFCQEDGCSQKLQTPLPKPIGGFDNSMLVQEAAFAPDSPFMTFRDGEKTYKYHLGTHVMTMIADHALSLWRHENENIDILQYNLESKQLEWNRLSLFEKRSTPIHTWTGHTVYSYWDTNSGTLLFLWGTTNLTQFIPSLWSASGTLLWQGTTLVNNGALNSDTVMLETATKDPQKPQLQFLTLSGSVIGSYDGAIFFDTCQRYDSQLLCLDEGTGITRYDLTNGSAHELLHFPLDVGVRMIRSWKWETQKAKNGISTTLFFLDTKNQIYKLAVYLQTE